MVVFAFRTSRVSSYVQMQSFLPSGEVHEHVDDGPGRAFLISGSVGGRAASGWRAGGRFCISEPWSDSLTANPGQRLTVPDSLTALTALSPTV